MPLPERLTGAVTDDVVDWQHPWWWAVAACRGQEAAWFCPERGQSVATERARVICARCPAADECLAFALTAEPVVVGVWGGTTFQERAEIRRAYRSPTRDAVL